MWSSWCRAAPSDQRDSAKVLLVMMLPFEHLLEDHLIGSGPNLLDEFQIPPFSLSSVCSCFHSCCSFCTPKVSGLQFGQRVIGVRQPLIHSGSVHVKPSDAAVHRLYATQLIWSLCFTVKGKYAGGNPVCPRPTPTWQKGIGDFFGGPPRKPEKENLKPTESDEEEAGGSGMSKASRKYVLYLTWFMFYSSWEKAAVIWSHWADSSCSRATKGLH